MKNSILTREVCRSCGSKLLTKLVGYKDYPFPDNFLHEDILTSEEMLADYALYKCAHCHLVQTLHDVDWESYYADYEYTVSTSDSALQMMDVFAENLCTRYLFLSSGRIVEFGSGDGEQLKPFQRRGADVLGFEPAFNLSEKANSQGVPTLQRMFNSASVEDINQPFDMVFSSFTFDHVADPVEVLKVAAHVLHPAQGILVIEVHDLEKIIKRNEGCLFVHEHPVYYSVRSLASVLRNSGFSIIHTNIVDEKNRRGNSLIIVACLNSNVGNLATQEELAEVAEVIKRQSYLDSNDTYIHFFNDQTSAYARFKKYVSEQNAKGVRVAGYGVSARSTMTFYHTGVNSSDIPFICDRNHKFDGKYLPVSRIPIHHANYLNNHPVDELIVFSYGYIKEIEQQYKDLVGRGMKITSMLNILRKEDQQ